MRAGDRPCGAGEIVQLDQLVAHGIGDAFAAVAHVDCPDTARHGIKVFFALLVPNPHALAFDNDARIGGLIGFVLAQMVPDMRAVGFDNAGDVVLVEIAVHGANLSVRVGEPTNEARTEAGNVRITSPRKPHRK